MSIHGGLLPKKRHRKQQMAMSGSMLIFGIIAVAVLDVCQGPQKGIRRYTIWSEAWSLGIHRYLPKQHWNFLLFF